MKDCPSGGSVSSVKAVEQCESSVSPGEIKGSSYGNTDRVMEYAAARIWSSVCHLGC